MGSYTIPSILIGMIMLSMVIGLSMVFMTDVVTNYGVTGTTNYTYLSKMDELQGEVSDLSGTMQNTTKDPSVTDFTAGVASGIWRSMWLTFHSVNIAQEMADEAVTETGIPLNIGGFLAGAIAIFSLIVIGALITLVTKTG